MIVIIDNCDSFVFNIARYFRKLGQATKVIRNDAVGVSDVIDLKPRAVVISPGPCPPLEAGVSTAVVRELSGCIPILGICLGHQCIGSVFGGRVARARYPMHGRASHMLHDRHGLFENLPSPLRVGRDHSLVVELDGSVRRISQSRHVRMKMRSWPSHAAIIEDMVCNSTRNPYSHRVDTRYLQIFFDLQTKVSEPSQPFCLQIKEIQQSRQDVATTPHGVRSNAFQGQRGSDPLTGRKVRVKKDKNSEA